MQRARQAGASSTEGASPLETHPPTHPPPAPQLSEPSGTSGAAAAPRPTHRPRCSLPRGGWPAPCPRLGSLARRCRRRRPLPRLPLFPQPGLRRVDSGCLSPLPPAGSHTIWRAADSRLRRGGRREKRETGAGLFMAAEAWERGAGGGGREEAARLSSGVLPTGGGVRLFCCRRIFGRSSTCSSARVGFMRGLGSKAEASQPHGGA